MDFIKEIVHRESFKRIVFFIVLILVLYFMKPMINLVLLTFLFTYLINSVESFITLKLSKYIRVSEKFVTLILYIAIITIIVVVSYRYIPIVVNEAKNLINQAESFYESSSKVGKYAILDKYVTPIIQNINIENYTKDGAKYVIEFASSVGAMSVQTVLALILSLFFILEKKEILVFGKKFETSKLSTMYKYFVHFGNNFLNSFGKVIRAQIIIAFVNTILSVIGLTILGFPNILTLSVMIFVLSLIPVAGVIVSLVPLTLIAFNINGPIEVLYVLILVGIIHVVESYFLNPKLMSSKTQIPIFFTFVILLVSDHFLGTWGLLLGIPLFMFILDVFEVNLSGNAKSVKNVFKLKKK
ncbi:AI-2E family transporter [Clostridium hydrogenum]|uniref:AI-2E family transporter n=1 Tax=Clostridium hydrogenum TaxID=2855764 RepID=UPI002E33491B|nr:AI-2E family transporter [Clostridium hydrogenum]